MLENNKSTLTTPQAQMAPPPKIQSQKPIVSSPVKPRASASLGSQASVLPQDNSKSVSTVASSKIKLDFGSKFFWLVLALVGVSFLAIFALIVSLRFTDTF